MRAAAQRDFAGDFPYRRGGAESPGQPAKDRGPRPARLVVDRRRPGQPGRVHQRRWLENSVQSKTAVEKSIQSKMTVGRMLATIAPVDESYRRKTDWIQPNPNRSITKGDIISRFHDDADEKSPESGIGVMKITIRCARLFANSLPPDSDPSQVFEQGQGRELQRADLYVRITPRGKNEKSFIKLSATIVTL